MTWTLHQDLSISDTVDHRSQIVVNAAGTVAYFIASLKVYSYNGSSLTDITGTTFSSLNGGSGGTPAGICFFNGTLYCLISGAGTTDTGLYSYDGTGTNWTQETQHLDDADTWPMGYEQYDYYNLSPIATDGTNFVVVSGSESGTSRLWSSTNPASPSRVSLGGDYDDPYTTLIGAFLGIDTVYGQDDEADRCIEITATASNLGSGAVTDPLIFAVDDNLQFFSIADGSNWQLGYSTDWGGTITGTTPPYRSSGYRRYWRMFYDGTDVWLGGIFGDTNRDRIYKWNNTTKAWDLNAEDSAHGGPLGGTPYGFFILNGHIYCLAASGTTDVKFYDGGALGGAALEFWQAQNGIGATRRSEMTITGINPGGLLVRDDGAVWAGSNQAADSVKAERATDADDYANWTDMTGSLTDPVEALDGT
jgi:hypothetical protein